MITEEELGGQEQTEYLKDTQFTQDIQEHLARIKEDYFQTIKTRKSVEKFLTTASWHLAGHAIGLFLIQYNLAILQVFAIAWFVSAIPGFLELNNLRINKKEDWEVEGMDSFFQGTLKLATATIAAYFAIKEVSSLVHDSQEAFKIVSAQIHHYEVKPSTAPHHDLFSYALVAIAVILAVGLFKGKR